MKKIIAFIMITVSVTGISAQNKELYDRKLKAVEQVMIIDSLVVPRAQLLEHLVISMESGRVMTTDSALSTRDSLHTTAFISQLDNQLVYARQTTSGLLRLYRCDKVDDKWNSATELAGLPDDESQNYPFMLTDGTTLYYAAQGPNSLGGYDIFMTRYDADTKSFLAPENIGMPFNSTANDYLYMVDEYHDIGYFVTDRRQTPGYVCIYTFVPNEIRNVYSLENTPQNKIVSLAELYSIKETQTDTRTMREAIVRLQQMKENVYANPADNAEIYFIINDRYTYTSFSQFRNENACVEAHKWQQTKLMFAVESDKLAKLREEYHHGNVNEREKLKEQILNLEKTVENLQETISKQEKAIRSLEGR